MQIIFDISIVLKNKHVYSMLRKTYDYDIYFSTQTQFEDGAWDDPKTPHSVTYSLGDGYCLIDFEVIECNSKKECESEKQRHKHSGWESPSKIKH